ncbi:MAG TPA: homoserine dehydrogenase, partial [Solirubrobacteraceae bacterium]|nr:homoserine dehydrogenase [Solirubrobacteraceae bacterium]
MPETYRVGLLGHGTVGAAFEALLAERADAIAHITGFKPEVTGVLTRSRGDFEEILESADLIVELIGGIDPARDYVLRAMKAGKHVVSANKLLLASYGEELWSVARENEVQLRFEGAVAGVVPVIRVLQESLAGAHVERIHGIVNGTTNFILTEMARGGATYEAALARAQQLGYAEADPTDDVTGRDAAAKMAILARLAFSTPVHLDQVVYEGIEHI